MDLSKKSQVWQIGYFLSIFLCSLLFVFLAESRSNYNAEYKYELQLCFAIHWKQDTCICITFHRWVEKQTKAIFLIFNQVLQMTKPEVEPKVKI